MDDIPVVSARTVGEKIGILVPGGGGSSDHSDPPLAIGLVIQNDNLL